MQRGLISGSPFFLRCANDLLNVSYKLFADGTSVFFEGLEYNIMFTNNKQDHVEMLRFLSLLNYMI